MPELPEFVEPMLAKKRGEPFDSDEHLFEIKWDGFRALAFADGRELRVLTRNRQDLLRRHPELGALGALPPGCVLDGELVALRGGRPAFESVARRDGATAYVAFDVLYEGFEPCLAEPLVQRRERLLRLCAALGDPRIVASDGVVGAGALFFERACEQGLEGVIAKRLDSPYRPGRRTDAWQKVKRSQRMHCAVVGWLEADDDPRDFKSLVVAAPDDDGVLRVVGRVGSGFSADERAALRDELHGRAAREPLVESDEPARWIDPPLLCVVGFLERTRAGMLRAPVFEGVVEG